MLDDTFMCQYLGQEKDKFQVNGFWMWKYFEVVMLHILEVLSQKKCGNSSLRKCKTLADKTWQHIQDEGQDQYVCVTKSQAVDFFFFFCLVT